MYERQPDAAQLEAFGLTAADLGQQQDVEVWPDNWQAVQLLNRMSTQWRVGFGGAVGLDYNVLYRMMDRLKLGGIEEEELEKDIQVMELEALQVMAEAASQ
ncbi:DUF1799 domain-containing protein [Chromobacterium violaceum]|uniref:DUF1799 domain-containing protein n=1 Tax=Chromobacterium violaceum TaxID=536 RepID=A0A202BD17_CHRVL|nr:DUF1799 domain-containing protein [Chromobacterium violaceum]OVE49453.1 hypothetical protein CBW21_06105 [Chromobacterium violaceum]